MNSISFIIWLSKKKNRTIMIHEHNWWQGSNLFSTAGCVPKANKETRTRCSCAKGPETCWATVCVEPWNFHDPWNWRRVKSKKDRGQEWGARCRVWEHLTEVSQTKLHKGKIGEKTEPCLLYYRCSYVLCLNTNCPHLTPTNTASWMWCKATHLTFSSKFLNPKLETIKLASALKKDSPQ